MLAFLAALQRRVHFWGFLVPGAIGLVSEHLGIVNGGATRASDKDGGGAVERTLR